ncbi:MAG: hypothetical protein ACWA41_02650 [Putridiphycobacter sp.]
MSIFKGSLNIIIALLMYLPTLAFMPSWLYLLLIPIALVLNQNFILDFLKAIRQFKLADKYFAFFLLFALIALIFRLVDYPNWHSIKDFYSFAFLFPFTYLVAKMVANRPTIFKYIVYFVIVESIFGMIQYAFGVNSFFSSLKLYREFESYDMLYYTRIFGLSANSSGLTIKLIFGLLLLHKLDWSENWKKGVELLFLFTSIIAFGRIALIVVFVYFFLRLFDEIFIRKTFKFKTYIPFLIFFAVFAVNPVWTKNQFTRNEMKVSDHSTFEGEEIEEEIEEIDMSLLEELGLANVNMSGRTHIWLAYTTYGTKHYAMGYKGKKFMLGHVHAHNSYLEMYASFGAFMLLAIMVIIFSKINKSNFVIVGSILVLAFGQYIIFWGISIYDILFYSILFFNPPLPVNEK